LTILPCRKRCEAESVKGGDARALPWRGMDDLLVKVKGARASAPKERGGKSFNDVREKGGAFSNSNN